jgi:hypothetical protein
MEDPSTIRRADELAAIDLAPYEGIRDRDKRQRKPPMSQCTPSVLCSQYVLLQFGVLACFRLQWPSLKTVVACFENAANLQD